MEQRKVKVENIRTDSKHDKDICCCTQPTQAQACKFVFTKVLHRFFRIFSGRNVNWMRDQYLSSTTSLGHDPVLFDWLTKKPRTGGVIYHTSSLYTTIHLSTRSLRNVPKNCRKLCALFLPPSSVACGHRMGERYQLIIRIWQIIDELWGNEENYI